MQKPFLFFSIFVCIIACTIESGNDDPDPLFPTPILIDEPEPDSKTPIPGAIQPVSEPEPVIIEPGPVPPHAGARDLVAPKLLTSSIGAGQRGIDVDLEEIRLSFDEEIHKSTLKIVNKQNVSKGWTQSINEKEVLLTKRNGTNLLAEKQYFVIGTVEDEHQNARVILIPFEVGSKDNRAPNLIHSTINHGDVGVDPDTERFVFTFDEEIDRADIKLINNARNTDLQWTTLIDGDRVILLKLPNEGKRMVEGELHTIRLRWRDAAGNWEPKDFGVIRIITFVTGGKE